MSLNLVKISTFAAEHIHCTFLHYIIITSLTLYKSMLVSSRGDSGMSVYKLHKCINVVKCNLSVNHQGK